MFRLARRLGYAHPDFLLDELTSRQITELIAYDVIDPVGDWRMDYQTAMLSTVLTNIAKRKAGDNSKPVEIFDFMPKWGEDNDDAAEVKKQQTTEEMLRIMNQIAKK